MMCSPCGGLYAFTARGDFKELCLSTVTQRTIKENRVVLTVDTSFNLFSQIFCRTQWPSPEEYSQLEVQTSLGRTDIVRWFKDHRLVLKNGESLDWMEGFQNPNLAEQQKEGQEQSKSISLEVKAEPGEFWKRACVSLLR